MAIEFLEKYSEFYKELKEFGESDGNNDLEELATANGLTVEQFCNIVTVLQNLADDQESIYNYAFNQNKALYSRLTDHLDNLSQLLDVAEYLIIHESLRNKIKIQMGLPETLSAVVPRVEIDFTSPIFWINLDLPEGLARTYDKTTTGVTECAAQKGALKCLIWLNDQNLLSGENALTNEAAKYGHLECVKWLISHGQHCNVITSARAAASGYLECLEWLINNGCDYDSSVCCEAASHGHLRILKWAHQHGCPWNTWTCNEAAQYGHLECLKWAHENGCPWNQNIITGYGAESGNLELVKWLVNKGCPITQDTFVYAAKGGNLELLEWLREQECPWYEGVCQTAAQYGNLEALKWLRVNGCPWNWGTISFASSSGHLDCLQWAHNHGCPWGGPNTSSWAAMRGFFNCFTWAVENGCPWDKEFCKQFACNFPHTSVAKEKLLKWISEHEHLEEAGF